MKIGIRLTALLFCLAFLCTGLAACKSGNGKGGETTKKSGEIVNPGGQDDKIYDNDFGGRKFTICNSINEALGYTTSNTLIQGPETLTDGAEAKVFQRNAWMEEKLNMSFQYNNVNVGYASVAETLRPRLMNGDAVDLYINKLYPMASLSMEGWFANIANQPELQYFEDYWYSDYMNGLSLDEGNNAYLLAGDYFMDIIQSSAVLFCNTSILNEVYSAKGGTDAFINDVFDGKWTYEVMSELVAGAYFDADGNGSVNNGDRMGFSCDQIWGDLIPMVTSANLKYIEKDGSDWKLAINNDDSLALFDILRTMLYGKGTTPMNKTTELVYASAFETEALPYFLNKNALFTAGRFAKMSQVAAVEMNWTVIPYPKLKEAQSGYVTPTHDTTELGAIPRTCGDLSTVLTMLEILSERTHALVMPEYYDRTLKSRYSQDPTTAKLVDLVHNTMGGAFTMAYSNYCGDIFVWKAFYEPLYNGQEFTSSYRGFETAGNGYIATMLDQWKKISKS